MNKLLIIFLSMASLRAMDNGAYYSSTFESSWKQPSAPPVELFAEIAALKKVIRDQATEKLLRAIDKKDGAELQKLLSDLQNRDKYSVEEAKAIGYLVIEKLQSKDNNVPNLIDFEDTKDVKKLATRNILITTEVKNYATQAGLVALPTLAILGILAFLSK